MTDLQHGDDSDKQYQYELASENKEYVAAHLNETDEIRENGIAEMKRWIEKNDDLCARTGKNSEIRLVS